MDTVQPLKRIRIASDYLVGPAVVVDGTVFALSAPDVLVALDSTSFVERWRIDVRPGIDAHSNHKGAVIVLLSATQDGDVLLSSMAKVLQAIDQTGTVRWTRAGAPMQWRLHGSLILAPEASLLSLIEPASGACVEAIPLPFEAALGSGAAVVADIAILRSANGSSYCGVDLLRRRVAWHRPLPAEIEGEFGMRIDSIWAWFGDANGAVGYGPKHLLSCDPETGAPRWCRPTWLQLGMPTVADGRAYYWPWTPETPNHVVALDQATGAVIYDTDLRPLGEEFRGSQESYSPVVFGDTLAFTTRQGVTLLLRRSDGIPLGWHKHSQGLNAPAVCRDKVLVTSKSGHLLIFEVPE